MMQIFVKNTQGNTTTLNVESNERICSIKSKLKEKEGIRSDLHLGLIYNGKLLEDGLTLAHYGISKQCTLRFFLSQDSLVETWILLVKTWSLKVFTLKVTSEDTIDNVKAEIQEKEGIPPHKQLLFDHDKWLEDGSRTLADYDISNCYTLNLAIQLEQGPQSAAATQPNVTSQVAPRQTKRARPATPNKATSICNTALSDLMPESQACPASLVLTKLEDVKREMAAARCKEKGLEAAISRLKAENNKNEQEFMINARNREKGMEAAISRLKAENKKKEEELMINARNREMVLEAAISLLKAANKKKEEELMINARNREMILEAAISRLKAANKKKEEELMINARNREMVLEAAIFRLKAANKKKEEELMNADKKYYAGARVAGYAEGLKERKAKRLKFG